MANQELKLNEGLNNVEIEGILEEKDIKIVEGEYKTGENKGKEFKKIQGKLVVRTSDTDTHTIKIEANAKTSTGKDNSMFKGYETIMNTYKSLAEIKKDNGDESEVTMVNITAKFDINDYLNKKDEMVAAVDIKGKFVNRIENAELYKPKATFDIEFYISEIKKEKDKSQEDTGRLLVKGYIVKYGSKIFPIDFIVAKEDDVAEYFEDEFRVGDTVNMWGNLINSSTTQTKEKKGFGKAKQDTTTSFKHEIVITGGEEEAYEGEKAYDPEIIKKAVAERKTYVDDKERKDREYKANKDNKSSSSSNEKRSGFKNKNKTESKPKVEDIKTDEIDDADIPF